MTKIKIGIIGFGNMGQAIAESLTYKNYKLFYNDKKVKTSKRVIYCPSLKKLADKAEVIILAVKPQDFSRLKSELKRYIKAKHIIISVMAGITLSTIAKDLKSHNIIRSMPNLALKYQASLTGWIAHQKCSKRTLQIARKIFLSWGKEIRCQKEEQLNIITATAGSGPAYFLLMADLIYQFALKNNFSKKQAYLMSQQVLRGTSLYYESEQILPSQIIKKITSKGGTTEVAFKYFQKHKIPEKILEGINQAQKRAKQLEA